ncbi:unnamed protein product [Closterium sp. NIES-54]
MRTSAFIGARVLQKLRDHFCHLSVWQRLRSSLAPSPYRCSRRSALYPTVAAPCIPPSQRPVSRHRGCRCGRRWRGGGRGGARVVDATLFAAAPRRYAATRRPFSLPAARAAVGGGRVWGGGSEQEAAAPPLSLTAARADVGGRVRGRRKSAGHLLLSPAAAVAPPAAAPAATCLCCLCFCYLPLGPAGAAVEPLLSCCTLQPQSLLLRRLAAPTPATVFALAEGLVQLDLPSLHRLPLHLPVAVISAAACLVYSIMGA